MKISVIGGGHVGATCAFLTAQKELGDVVLVDIVEGLPHGTALDMMQSSSVERFHKKVHGTNDFKDICDSDLIVVTAGLARKPGMTRLDLLAKNFAIIKSVTKNIAKFAPETKIIVVTNPLDVMVYVSLKESGFEKNRVFGMSGVLDSARFKHFIADELDVSIDDVSAMVIGSHSELMVPLPRFSSVSGIPLVELLPKEKIDRLIERTKKGGAEIVAHLKNGSAFYAPAASAVKMIEAVAKDKKKILPACVYLEGEYGLNDICLGVPVKIGKDGIEKVIELNLNSEEQSALNKSAESVREGIKNLKSQ
ncbi:malate dehydrogenase [Candidatus Oleimmundimicrobium sp.]|uniref:malate dehydrogenase n=1 Tax=Candidatus Oleimmundimicrobium sp. TaxID=3060597 RepID=UPI00271B18B9|nr:malate dehydrogenase [Candidatus Oleimmundimicrobium sp.]MDO8886427.1 malate dehydrogenase [Candidatus Oleimmundimicrobium sp.]